VNRIGIDSQFCSGEPHTSLSPGSGDIARPRHSVIPFLPALGDMYQLPPPSSKISRNLPNSVVPRCEQRLESSHAKRDVRYENTCPRVRDQSEAYRSKLTEIFRVLMDELHGVVQFDFVWISLHDKTPIRFKVMSSTWRSIRAASRRAVRPDETLHYGCYERRNLF